MSSPSQVSHQADTQVVGILLAAGKGSRLGYPKSTLKLKGQLVLPMLIEALTRGGCDEVRVVFSAESYKAFPHPEFLKANCLVNPTPELGRTNSLQFALKDLPNTQAILIHPCDVPLLSAQAVAHLLSSWRSAGNSSELVARPITPAGKGGHPLLVPASRIKEINSLRNDESLRQLLLPRHLRLDLAWRGDPGPFLGANTPEQLEFLESFLESPE